MEYSFFSPPQTYPGQMYLPPTAAGPSVSHGTPFEHSSSPHYPGSYPAHAFSQHYHYAAPGNSYAEPPPPSPPPPIGSSANVSGEPPSEEVPFGPGGDPVPASEGFGTEEPPRTRSSSEEKDPLTPAQSRRKAQNRAAQRAFRERKERHVKDLEHKLTSLQQTSSSLSGEVERLKRELAKTKTENDILKATNGGASSSTAVTKTSSYPEEPVTGPMSFAPTDLYTSVHDPASGKVTTARRSPNHRVATSENGEKLLNAGATWDLIQASDMFKRGLVDVGDVCERLKHMAKCDGQGPVFEESDVKGAIEESVAVGTDELIY